ncbi:MAG TPA: TRAP transporter large permease subunit [Anaeromyxobacteraceae bacterium]|nr:TRAP transporter large permease subunit [Anaeromyxobacteraceae bacterium]
MRKELWFGFILMALIVIPTLWFMPLSHMTLGHYGLLMLALVVVAIMLGFPTAFTLMGMGVLFTWIAYRAVNPELAVRQTLDLMVQRAYAVMTNDVLIAVPLFVFMGYLVERANLIERLFRSLHLAIGRIPGSLAVATLATCAVFATATGIIGAVVTLMGLLAFPAMLKSGYNIKLSAGVITAGGTLGILIPPSVLLILYGATASVSVVQLYAGAFLPGIMLAGLYMAYVMVMAKLRPEWAPKPPESETRVVLPPLAALLAGGRRRLAIPTLVGAVVNARKAGVPALASARQLGIALLPAIVLVLGAVVVYRGVTTREVVDTSGLQEMGLGDDQPGAEQEPGREEPPEAAPEEAGTSRYARDRSQPRRAEAAPAVAEGGRVPAPPTFWIAVGVLALVLLLFYAFQTFERLEVFKMMLGSFFPLAMLILAVLGSIIFGWATPTEAAAMGAGGGLLLAAAYRRLTFSVVKESVFLTGKTTAMVCWLFVGSSIFSAGFALLGGQEILEKWVLSLNMTPVQFMLLAQFIIFILGWPLEWTEIIVIFMPIFLPLLGHFHIDPLFFGLLVALNLQTAFLSPPVAMAAFYLKGVSPPHVTLNQIFAGMMPFMAIQVLALALLYIFPQIGLWLPSIVYK